MVRNCSKNIGADSDKWTENDTSNDNNITDEQSIEMRILQAGTAGGEVLPWPGLACSIAREHAHIINTLLIASTMKYLS